MKKLRLLTIAFDTTIQAYETPAFRGAVIEKVGVEHSWFHNHNIDPDTDQQYHYRYPLVQYKRSRKQPVLMFIDKGVDEAQYFFAQQNWDLTFGGKDHKMSIANMSVKLYDIGVYEQVFYYTLRRWMPLNSNNYATYNQLDSLQAQIAMLEQMLANHIISFAKGIECRFEKRFEVVITAILDQKVLSYKGVRVNTFDLRFKTNVLLPQLIGIGKGVAQGFGIVTKAKENPSS